MSSPRILKDSRYKRAFENIVQEEAEREEQQQGSQSGDQLRDWGATLIVPTVAAGGVGYIGGGPAEAAETVQQFSTTVLPYLPVIKGVGQYVRQSFVPGDQIRKRHTLSTVLALDEGYIEQLKVGGAVVSIFGGLFAGVSALTESFTGIPADQAQMAVTGGVTGGMYLMPLLYQGAQLRERIRSRVSEEPAGQDMDADGLERVVRGALRHADQAREIQHRTYEPRSRGVRALSRRSQEKGDVTHPHVGVYPLSDSVSFKFDAPGKPDPSAVARVMREHKPDAELVCTPVFRHSALDEQLESPAAQMRDFFVYGIYEDSKYFDLREGEGRLTLTINDKHQMDLLLALFSELYGRRLRDSDFDAELVSFACESLGRDPLERLAPLTLSDITKGYQGRDEPEHPPQDLELLAATTLEAYRANRDRIMPADGLEGLGVAFEGVCYLLQPGDDPADPEDAPDRQEIAEYLLKHPLDGLRGWRQDGEVVPSLLDVELYAQLPGITRENLPSVAGALEQRLGPLRSDPLTGGMDYDTFSRLDAEPGLLLQHALHWTLIDNAGTGIGITLGSGPGQHYARIRHSYSSREEPSYRHIGASGGAPAHLVVYDAGMLDSFRNNALVTVTTPVDSLDCQHPTKAVYQVTDRLAALREAVEEVTGYDGGGRHG